LQQKKIDYSFAKNNKRKNIIKKKSTVHTLTFDNNMLLSEDHIKKFNELIERSGFKIKEEQDMETIGSSKAKQNALPKKYTLEDWKKEADAARKRAIYWKKQSDQWEGRFFLFQDSIGGEIEAMNKKLESSETQLKWAHDANKELKASYIDLEGVNVDMSEDMIEIRKDNDELAADNSKHRLDIKLLKEDLDIEKQFNERLQDDHNVLKNIQRHTALLGWAGWIFFFVALFGMIFLRP
jgi:hypothetical protein